MPTLNAINASLRTKVTESISLVVARRNADGSFATKKVNLAASAADGFRDLCTDSLESLSTRTRAGYTADSELADSEVFVLDDAASLNELGAFHALLDAATLANTTPAELDLSIQLYAVVVGNSDRVAFVRRTDPSISYRGGRFLAIAGQQLTRIQQPAFTFSPGFDLIVSDEWAVILKQAAFERLFRDIGLVERHVDEWIKGITDSFPMSAESVAAMRAVATRDSRLWRKLREIRRRGHLAKVTLPDVSKYANAMGLDPNTFVRAGELVFDTEDAQGRFSFLHLLNEDLYKGPLTNETFEAQRKTATNT